MTHKIEHRIDLETAPDPKFVAGPNHPGKTSVFGPSPVLENDRVASDAEPSLEVEPGGGSGVELGDEQRATERFGDGAVLALGCLSDRVDREWHQDEKRCHRDSTR